MKRRNKLFQTVLCGVLVLFLFQILPISKVFAENETAGSTRADAKVIQLGETYSEMTVDGKDIDFFQVMTTEHGYFQVQMSQNKADSQDVHAGWEIKVLDEDGKEITSGSVAKEAWTSVVLPYAEAGRVFYIQVSPISWGVPKDCTYDLMVSQTASEEWESEPNETLATTTKIEVNKTYHGITTNQKDTDFFQFTTTKHGYFQVELGQNAADAHDIHAGWDVKVLDEDGKVIDSGTGTKEKWTSIILPYAEKEKNFYIQVTPVSWGVPKNCTYDLIVNQTSSNEWETEPNGTKETATTIKAGRTYQGITVSKEDEDYYKLVVSAAGKLKIQLRPSDTNLSDSIHAGWNIVVFDSDSKEISKINGVKTVDSISFNVKKGTYYISVKGVSWSSPIKCRYELSTSYVKQPAKPVISSLKSKGKTATITWKKVSGATGYIIYRSAGKGQAYQKVKTITNSATTSWKNSGLKAGNYYYKVVAYKKGTGVTASSAYSAAKGIKIK